MKNVTSKAMGKILLLLAIMLFMPLAEADANYYYKVRLRKDIKDNEGNITRVENYDWSDWIYNEAQLNDGETEVVDWKNSLRKLIEEGTVKDQNGKDVSLYYQNEKQERCRYRIVAIAFKGEKQDNKLEKLNYEDYGILDGDDYYYDTTEGRVYVFPQIKNDIIELDLSEWGKSFCNGSYYFSGMENLEILKLPANKFSIQEEGMFGSCHKLKKIEWSRYKDGVTPPRVGDTETKITAIGKEAFSSCTLLPEYYIQKMINECAEGNPNTFKDVDGNDINTSSTYIGEKAFYDCLELGVVYSSEPELDDKNFTSIDGTSDTEENNPMIEGSSSDGSLFDQGELIIPVGITGIGNEAFRKVSAGSALNKVTFETRRTEGVEIGDYAFDGQELLKDVELSGAHITILGEGAFRNCRAITSESVNNK